jgi:hypothetical protein
VWRVTDKLVYHCYLLKVSIYFLARWAKTIWQPCIPTSKPTTATFVISPENIFVDAGNVGMATTFLFTWVNRRRVTRFFAYWVIVYFGQFYENYRNSPYFLLLFPRKKLCINFDKNRLGYILGDFFHKLIWSPCNRVHDFFFQNFLGYNSSYHSGSISTSTKLLLLQKY